MPKPNSRVPKLFSAVTPEIIIFEVGTPTISFDSTPQINIVKIADLFSKCLPLSCLIFDSLACLVLKNYCIS